MDEISTEVSIFVLPHSLIREREREKRRFYGILHELTLPGQEHLHYRLYKIIQYSSCPNMCLLMKDF